MKQSKINKICSVCNYIAALLFYISAIINFADEKNTSMGIVWLCLGSTFLCLGAIYLQRNKKDKEEK